MSATDRCREIARIMDAVDQRCLFADGAVTKFQDEVRDGELRQIYRLAKTSARRQMPALARITGNLAR